MKLLSKNIISVDLKSNNKNDVIKELVSILNQDGRLNNEEKFLNDVLTREEESTTGMGHGIAIPHAQSEFVKVPSLVVAKSTSGIDFNSLDGEKVNLFFMIAVPVSGADEHLKLLQILARNLMKEEFKKELLSSTTKEQLFNAVSEIFKNDEKIHKVAETKKTKKLVAIANCPAGIAHTYMVAEALSNKASSLGYEIKVETQGAIGVENNLTREDIKNADYVILALGKSLSDEEKLRFNGKMVYNIPIGEALKNVDRIFEDVETKSRLMDASVESEYDEEPQLKGIFQHLMNGVSMVIPFVVAGGLLLSLTTILMQFGYTGEFVTMLESVGVYGMMFMTPVLGGYIAYSIADKPGLAPGFILAYLANDKGVLGTEAGAGFLGAIVIGLLVGYFVKWMKAINVHKDIKPLMSFLIIPFVTTLVGASLVYLFIGPFLSSIMTLLTSLLVNANGSSALICSVIIAMMIAFDAGGPVNKTAFLFALGLVAEGSFAYYGIVAVGVIVPTMAVGFATVFRPKLFTKQEFENGKAAIVSSAFGISEPAIPYIVADPIALISANVLAAIYTGTMCFFLGVERMAPGPGIFEPILGITTPLFATYFIIITGVILNMILIIVFKSITAKRRIMNV